MPVENGNLWPPLKTQHFQHIWETTHYSFTKNFPFKSIQKRFIAMHIAKFVKKTKQEKKLLFKQKNVNIKLHF